MTSSPVIKTRKATPSQIANLDKNTGLYDQSFFKDRLGFSLKQSKETNQICFAVLSFNLIQKDSIKKPLDAKIWESIYIKTSKSLRSTVRITDIFTRFDQEIFCVLIENISPEDKEIIISIATRIQEKLNQNFAEKGSKIQIPIRMGITLCDSEYESIDEILHDATNAQILANAQGDDYYKNILL